MVGSDGIAVQQAEDLFHQGNFEAAAFHYQKLIEGDFKLLAQLRLALIDSVRGEHEKGVEGVAGTTEGGAQINSGVPHPAQWSSLFLSLLAHRLVSPALETLDKFPDLKSHYQMKRVQWLAGLFLNYAPGQRIPLTELEEVQGASLLPGEVPSSFYDFVGLAACLLNSAGYVQEVTVLTNHALVMKNPIDSQVRVERLGTEYGGWTIPEGELSAESIVYCAGVGEDISFDLAVLEKYGCDVYGFDPTPRSKKFVEENTASQEKYRFYDYGLWETDAELTFFEPENPEHVSHSVHDLQKTTRAGFQAKVKRLKSILAELGHARVDLLKMDIEGAEYPVVKTLLEDQIPIGALCIEYHTLPKRPDERLRSIESLLESGYRLIAIENDNYSFVGKG